MQRVYFLPCLVVNFRLKSHLGENFVGIPLHVSYWTPRAMPSTSTADTIQAGFSPGTVLRLGTCMRQPVPKLRSGTASALLRDRYGAAPHLLSKQAAPLRSVRCVWQKTRRKKTRKQKPSEG